MRDQVEATIKELMQEKRDRKVLPDYVTFQELAQRIKAPKEEIYAGLGILRQEGLITGGRTINGFWINIVEQ